MKLDIDRHTYASCIAALDFCVKTSGPTAPDIRERMDNALTLMRRAFQDSINEDMQQFSDSQAQL